MLNTRKELLTWIEKTKKSKGWSLNKWAKEAGLAATTLTRFVNHDDAPMLSTRTIGKLERAAGGEEQPFQTGRKPAHSVDRTLVRDTLIEVLAALEESGTKLGPEETAEVLETVISVYADAENPPGRDRLKETAAAVVRHESRRKQGR